MANGGYEITIPGANYAVITPDVYLVNSGIEDVNVKTHFLTFKNTLIANNIWDKIIYANAILGTTVNQIKFNIKNGADPLTNAGGGTIVNTINKGIVLAGVGNSQGSTIDVPLTETFIQSVLSGSGHAMYFINENLVATNTTIPGIGIPLSSNLFAQSAPLFSLTGAVGTSPQKKGLYLRNTSSLLSPSFLSKGPFGVIKNGSTSEFFGNAVSLGTVTHSGTANAFTGNIRIGDGKYPVANTISYISFGNIAMSAAEMVIYQNAVKTLIQNVHGIVV